MTALITNQTFDALIQHLQQMGDAIRVTPTEDPLYQEFIARFPANQLTKLSLEQYCIGKADSQSFCWWLERGLEPVLGRYMPGTARGHILYFQPDGVVYKHRNLKDLSDQDALEYTLAVQAAIANVTDSEDWLWIDIRSKLFERASVSPRVTLGVGRKLRLLAVYHPDTALPISSAKHIAHFLEALGCPKHNIPVEKHAVARMYLLRDYYLLAKEQLPELTPLGFVRALYSPELKLAPSKEEVDETDMVDEEPSVTKHNTLKAPLNQILFGPPGTGKTYISMEAAVIAAEPSYHWDSRDELKSKYKELVDAKRIVFVTFHQSYSYEDFVEGLTANSENGQIQYNPKSGVFKNLVLEAKKHQYSAVQKAEESFDLCWDLFLEQLSEQPDGVKVSTRRSFILVTEVDGNTIRFDKAAGESVHSLSANTLRALFNQQRIIKGGLQPYYESLVSHLKALGKQQNSTNVTRKNFVLVIDEINRGNISRIFGELITLIEPSKRMGSADALDVQLPLTGDRFAVPDNLYIIGTMNTADRSLAGLDLALRRRFTFIEMPPRPELLDEVNVEGVNIGALLRVMNQRIAVLLDRDHCLGHAYFMPLMENNHLAQLREIFKQKIIPLLQEYFFEDWQRIRWVLNDQNKDETAAFVVEDQSLSLDSLFRGVDSGLPNRTVWQLNEAAFDNIAAYQGIL